MCVSKSWHRCVYLRQCVTSYLFSALRLDPSMHENIKDLLSSACLQHLNVNQIQVVVRRCSSPNVTEETTYFIPRNPVVDAGTNTDPPVVCCPLLRRFCPCPPRGLLASLVTKGEWGIVSSSGSGSGGVLDSSAAWCLRPPQSFWRPSFLERCGPSPRTNVFLEATSSVSQRSSSARSSVANWWLFSVCPASHRSHLCWVRRFYLQTLFLITPVLSRCRNSFKLHERSTIRSSTTYFPFLNDLYWKYMKVF